MGEKFFARIQRIIGIRRNIESNELGNEKINTDN